MPSISNMSFDVVFNLTGVPTLELTDTTTSAPTGMVGIFSITQPDGYTREGDIDNPDIASPGGTFDIALRLASDGKTQRGTYTITFTAVAPGYIGTNFTRTFEYQYEEVELDLREEFDVFTPKLEYYDDTVYQVSNYNNSSVTRSWNVVSSATGTITGTGTSIDINDGGDYYDANYTVTLESQIVYTHQVYTWLSVNELITKTVSTYAETPPTIEEFTELIAELKDVLEDKVDTLSEFDQTRQDLEYSQSLFGHILDRLRTEVTSGIQRDLKDLIAILHNYQIPAYTPANIPIDPYIFPTYGSWGVGSGVVTYDASGSEGDTFTVPGLAGKRVYAAQREIGYKRVTTGTPDGGSIQVHGTLGANGTILADGTVSIQAGDALLPGEKIDFLINA